MSGEGQFLDAATCVDEMLQGLTAAHPPLLILPGTRVTVDTARLRGEAGLPGVGQSVSLVSGGGSGHEPFAAGFVGSGLLAVSVSGSVFSSPPATAVVHAIHAAAASTTGGVLVIVLNYTGDRLNFGRAVEICKAAGIHVEMFVTGEDSALTKLNASVGKRGLCGTLFLLKILGALSSCGMAMDGLLKECHKFSSACGTLGVAATGCTLPGATQPLFTVETGTMELGLGVHGEAGIDILRKKDNKNLGTRALVSRMLEHMTSKDSESSVRLEPGDAVALMMNNLGAMTHMEMLVLTQETKQQLIDRKIIIERVYVGPLLTSLNMKGFHISILNVTNNKHWLEALDRHTSAPAWPTHNGAGVEQLDANIIAKLSGPFAHSMQATTHNTIKDGPAQWLQLVVRAIVSTVPTWAAALNALDASCGDGDCGTSLAEGAAKVNSRLQELTYNQPGLLLQELADILADSMGGTSGGLYSILLSVMGSRLKAMAMDGVPLRGVQWIDAFSAGVDAIAKYGGARQGDRTMLDALGPALEAARRAQTPDDYQALLSLMSAAALNGAQQTITMAARAGRASYVRGGGEGEMDAGARAIALLFKTIVDIITLENSVKEL